MFRSIQFASRSPAITPHAIAVGVFKSTPPKPGSSPAPPSLPAGYARLDDQCHGSLSAAVERAEFSADRGSVTPVYPQAAGGTKAKAPQRVYVLGLGEQATFSGDAVRIAAARLVRVLFKAKVQRIRFDLLEAIGDRLEAQAAGRAIADGLSIGNFEFEQFKGRAANGSDRNNTPMDLKVEVEPALVDAFKRWLEVGECMNQARAWAATPPNVANPSYLVSQCNQLARELGLKCTVIDTKQAKRLNMQGLLSVGAAGSTPPALICLEYLPPASKKSRSPKTRPIMLVGKAVTFDTGGYSLKPPASMEGMKYDKCGGMAVIGTLMAAAKLRLPTHIVGVIPTAENMVDEKSYRPGDILTMHNGVTVEVTNTDAEGRLILADALAYAGKRYQPQLVIDLATLTGGVVVALGSFCAGLFCNDPRLLQTLQDAGQETQEKLWPLPLWDDHRQLIKGTHSDIVNSAGRDAHPIQGAAFLSYFIDDQSTSGLPKLPWAHIDIAGVADVKGDKNPLFAPGPTGFGVRLLVRFLESWTAKP